MVEVGGVEPPSKGPFSVRLRVYPAVWLSGRRSPAGGLPAALSSLSFAVCYEVLQGLAFFWFSSRPAKGRAERSLSHLSSEKGVVIGAS